MNAATRLITNTWNFDRGLKYMQRHVLHWLDISLCVTVYKCVHGMAPGYLLELCRPVSALQGRRHLHSAGRRHLDFPRVMPQQKAVVCFELIT